MTENLSESEKQTLLHLAREALECGVHAKKELPVVEASLLTPLLRADGAAFVTLTVKGKLRGCIGALQPYQPLYEDVREHAIAAALDDHRFPPVRPGELSQIQIEISRLTMPRTLIYKDADDLLVKLQPNIDGVILRDGQRRATFLPQVWAQIPNKRDFLGHLCVKMGAASSLWQQKHLDVQIYQVEEFHEQDKPVTA